MIVQIKPRVSFGLPSTMSSARMFTNLIWVQSKDLVLICYTCNVVFKFLNKFMKQSFSRETDI